MDRIENAYLKSGITRIHVSRPRKNAPTLLFVHGGPGNPNRHKVFHRLRMLKRHFALAAYDAYGCGDSSHPRQLHVATLVTQLIEIAEYLKKACPSPIILIGESFGSGISLLALEQRPDLFSSYIGYGQVYNRKDMMENQMDLFLEKLKTKGAYDRISYWKTHRKDLVSAKFDSVWYQRFYMEYYPLMGQNCCCRVPFQDLSQCRGNAWQLIVQSSSLLFLHHLFIVHAQCSLHEKSACFFPSFGYGTKRMLCLIDFQVVSYRFLST